MATGNHSDEVVRDIVRGMLKSGLVDEVLAFVEGLDESDIVPAFISDEQDVDRVSTAAYNPSSLAKLLSDFADKDKRIGVVVRSCDARGIIELAKRHQVNLDNIHMVGLDCHGVTKPGAVREGDQPLSDEMLNPACRRCEYPVPTMADMVCYVGGSRAAIKVYTGKGEKMASAAGIPPGDVEVDISEAKERARRWQEKDFGELKAMSREERLKYWFSQFDKCIKCYGCRSSCPICYCEDCYLGADRVLIKRGEFPPEKLFHLTRLIHVADSCLNCGQCEAACPMHIPISKLYHMLNKELSAVFAYDAGLDVTSMPPLGSITERDKEMGGVEFG